MTSAETQLYLLGLSGELSVKGHATRQRFAERLEANLRAALRAQGLSFRLERRWSRFLLESSSPLAPEVARRVFGLAFVARALVRPFTGLEDLLVQGAEVFAPWVRGRSFAVRASRGERASLLPFRSPEIERRLGALLRPEALRVDLENPDFEARVEIHGEKVYFFSERFEAEGGLPVGTEGKALALVSGGFDSVVAAWQLLRRGMKLDYFLASLGGRAQVAQVRPILRQLASDWSAGSRPRLHVVDFRPLLAELELKVPARLRQVLLKRLMVRAAAVVAQRRGIKALASGEVLGQVSSQTLPNLAVIERASELILLRPLLTAGKEEILAQARKIGSFEASSRVPEHCFLGVKNPSTAATRAEVEAAETKLDGAVFEGVLHLAESFELLAEIQEEPLAEEGEEGEVELPPPLVPLFDLRSAAAFAAWHPPGALNLPYALALRAVVEGSFPALPAVVLLCEIGYKSAHLAELLRARGVRASSLRGGVGPLRDKLADPALMAALSPALLQGE